MKKTYIILIVLVLASCSLQAQVGFGIGTDSPNPNAILDIEANNKGVLVPRLSTVERLAITGLGNVEKSLLVFDIDFNHFFFWNGSQWVGLPLDNDAINELQDLTLQNDSILISNGNGIDVSGLIDSGTDDQNLTSATLNAANILTLNIENGNSASVNLSALDNAQTDDQNLTSATLNSSNILTINIENGNSTSVNLSALDNNTQSEDHDWYEMGSTDEPNSIYDNIYTQGNVSIATNIENASNLNVLRNVQIGNAWGNTGMNSSFGLAVGDSNTVSTSLPSITIGNKNTNQGIPRFVFGDNNYAIGSSTGSSFLVGDTDTLITSGHDNELYLFGRNSNIRSSGSGNLNIIFGKRNKIAASGGNRIMSITGMDNHIINSGNNNTGIILGRNNDLNFQGSGDMGYVFGENNYVDKPDYSFVLGKNDSIFQSAEAFVLGANNKIRRYTNTAYAFGYDIEIEEYRSHNFILGNNVYSDNNGVMVLTDRYTGATVLSPTTNNSMTMRFAGGYRLFSNHALSSGVSLASGAGAWATISDKNKKENFMNLNKQEILHKISGFKIQNWNYISQEDNVRHIGPYAQDFYAAFGLGTSDKSIVTSDISGVNMVAIQALHENNKALEEKVSSLESTIKALEEQLNALLKQSK